MDLELFTYGDQQVRTVVIDDEPWFALVDLCKVLNINRRDVKDRLDDGVVATHPIPDRMGRIQNALIVNEDGLYDVILESRKPEAKRFRKWITSEVIPTIRKTGHYGTPSAPAFTLPQTYADALKELAATVEAKEAAEAQAIASAAYAEQLEPAASAWAEVMDADGTYDMNATAKILGTGRVRLMAQLRADGVLNLDNLPRQQHVNAGRFRVKVGRPWQKPDGTMHVSRSTRVTPKGLMWVADRYGYRPGSGGMFTMGVSA
ncbi:phage antirepressor [Arsenicicoccus dermatophilus]|uniref:phage antirepressor n=1 Tax=Arsenicicoccus dermatophilus TaxID=1076331 RepID=UPI001F4C62BB|nr:phage antirepressor KilAC domain-containing protein [Arsenicicoccus dermatophilus]MCH8613455.1 phage antirepressor KilAC domain-containing protein [Arsenicicoccus dermatophilus]